MEDPKDSSSTSGKCYIPVTKDKRVSINKVSVEIIHDMNAYGAEFGKSVVNHVDCSKSARDVNKVQENVALSKLPGNHPPLKISSNIDAYQP